MKNQIEKILADRPYLDDNHAALVIAAATGETYEKVAKRLEVRNRALNVARIAKCTRTTAEKIIGVWLP